MDPTTQVTSVHGHAVLDLALQPLEACFALPLVHEIAGDNDRALLDVAVAAEVNLVGDPILVAADAARDAGNAPNAVMATAALDHRASPCRAGARLHPGADRPLRAFGAQGRARRGLRHSAASRSTRRRTRCSWPREEADDPRPEAMLAAIEARGGKSAFLKYLGTSAAGCRATRSSRRSPRRSPGGR